MIMLGRSTYTLPLSVIYPCGDMTATMVNHATFDFKAWLHSIFLAYPVTMSVEPVDGTGAKIEIGQAIFPKMSINPGKHYFDFATTIKLVDNDLLMDKFLSPMHDEGKEMKLYLDVHGLRLNELGFYPCPDLSMHKVLICKAKNRGGGGSWSKHMGENCYDGHGATAIDGSPIGKLSLADCQKMCDSTAGCTGITVAWSENGEPTDCWRRSNINIDACDEGDGYDTWTKSAGFANATAAKRIPANACNPAQLPETPSENELARTTDLVNMASRRLLGNYGQQGYEMTCVKGIGESSEPSVVV